MAGICEHCENAIGRRAIDIAVISAVLGKEYVFMKRILVCDSCKRKFQRANNKNMQKNTELLELKEKALREVELSGEI